MKVLAGIMTATTPQLLEIATEAMLSERPLREDVVLHPDGTHVLTALVVLDHRSGEHCDSFIRCRALLCTVSDPEPVEQSHLDVDIWQYAELTPASDDGIPMGFNVTVREEEGP